MAGTTSSSIGPRRSGGGAGGAASIESGLERLLEPALLAAGAVLAVAAVLPLLLVAGPVFLALYGLRTRSWRLKGPALVLCAVPALAALSVAYVTGGTEPGDVVMGYVDLQLDAGARLLTAWSGGEAFPWWSSTGWSYTDRVAPYALAGGLALGGATGFAFLSRSWFRTDAGKTALKLEDLGKLAAADETPVAWALPRVVGRGVLTLLSAAPGGGKGWWLQGLARAMDDGLDFFGLPVTPMKLLWATEEGESVTATARRFGIKPGRVEILRRDQVQGWSDWPELVRAIRKEAWKRKCQLVVFDTVRAWCPQAERTPELANEVMHAVRRELTEPGLGAVFVHHDRKGGGEHGEGVAGTFGLVGTVDVLVELRRVPGREEARQMVVSRRYGDLDITATLRGHRYVADRSDRQPSPPAPATIPTGAPAIPSHLQATLTTLTAAGAPQTTDELHAAEGGSPRALIARLRALEGLGLIAHDGRGVKGDPLRWRVTGADDSASPAPEPRTYDAYLKSAEWTVKRSQVLHRAGGRCERCHGAEAAEVHHLTYERVGDELPGDLQALCPPCHRLAHPRTT